MMDAVMYGVMFNAKIDIFSKDPPVIADKKLKPPSLKGEVTSATMSALTKGIAI